MEKFWNRKKSSYRRTGPEYRYEQKNEAKVPITPKSFPIYKYRGEPFLWNSIRDFGCNGGNKSMLPTFVGNLSSASQYLILIPPYMLAVYSDCSLLFKTNKLS